MLRSLSAISAALPMPTSIGATPLVAATAVARTASARPCARPFARLFTALRAPSASVTPSSSVSSSCPSAPTSCRCCSGTHSAARHSSSSLSRPLVSGAPSHSAARSFSTIEHIGTASPIPDGGVPSADDPHARFVVLYTCKVCETRSAKSVSRQAYTEGVVLLKCDGCTKLHLFADHLGWFDDNAVNIESIMAEKGLTVGRSSIDLKPHELQQIEQLQQSMKKQAEINRARIEAEEAAAKEKANTEAVKQDTHAPEAVLEKAPDLLK